MLEAHQLTKRYDTGRGTSKLALDELSLKLEPGEVFCLLGPNGAGKTTTVKLFLGFLKPTSGTVRVGGYNGSGSNSGGGDTSAKPRLGYIPENLSLYPTLTGYENLRFFSELSGERLGREQLEAALLRAGLDAEATHRPAGGYSKGMRQKVGIAIALARKSSALILDEPTSGLDPKAAHEFTEAIRAVGQAGTSVLMTTHDLFRAKAVADRIGIMSAGKLLRVFDPKSVDHTQLEEAYLSTI